MLVKKSFEEPLNNLDLSFTEVKTAIKLVGGLRKLNLNLVLVTNVPNFKLPNWITERLRLY